MKKMILIAVMGLLMASCTETDESSATYEALKREADAEVAALWGYDSKNVELSDEFWDVYAEEAEKVWVGE